MTNRTQALALTLLLLLAGAAALAQMPNIPQFSADMKMSSPEGQGATGKIYWGGNRMRMEMNMQGHEGIMIHDMPNKTSYMLMPQQHMYMEMSANNPMAQRMGRELKAYDPANPCANMEGYTCKKVGTETVNGRSCDTWEFTDPKGAKDRTVWIDQKLHFPIRSVSSDGHTMDLTNIQEASQPASLFQIPAGYTKMDMGGMMGRRPPQ